MKKIISTKFNVDDTPASGLSPTIRIWETTKEDNILVVNNEPMVESKVGVYEFEFNEYDPETEYLFKAFGGEVLPVSEQYNVFKNTDKIFESISRNGSIFKESSNSIILEATRKRDINDKVKSIISNVKAKPKDQVSTKSKKELQEEFYANEKAKFEKLFEETEQIKKLNEARKKSKLISDLLKK